MQHAGVAIDVSYEDAKATAVEARQTGNLPAAFPVTIPQMKMGCLELMAQNKLFWLQGVY